MNRSGGRISRTPTPPLAPSRGAASTAVSRRTHCHSYRHGRAGAFPGRGGNFPGAGAGCRQGLPRGGAAKPPPRGISRPAGASPRPSSDTGYPPRPGRGVLPSGDR